MPPPLTGLRIIELGGIGPGPFCGMMLADHGAEVIRVERPGAQPDADDPLLRSRASIIVDMKTTEGAAVVRDLARSADGLIEGYRPGVTERLGLGPDVLIADNPRLIYGRMTGWGQTGPLAHAAGHDINYIALSGTLHTIGRAGDKPVPPLNLVGDFGGGGMMLAFGMTCALLAVARGAGGGQVIDCAMTDGSALLNAMTWGFYGLGSWQDERGVNLLDTGAHFYETYECSDGKHIAIGSIEPQFYETLRQKLGLIDDLRFDAQLNQSAWQSLKHQLGNIFRRETRATWCALLEGTDACFAPVLSLHEAPRHPHNHARKTFIEVGNKIQPAPAPRYSKTAAERPNRFTLGSHTDRLLKELKYGKEQIAQLRASGVVA